MKNVYKTNITVFFIPETQWICERSICNLVCVPRGDIIIQKAQCGKLLNYCRLQFAWPGLPDRWCWLKFLSQAVICGTCCHLL